MHHRRMRLTIAAVGLAGAVALGACSGGSSASTGITAAPAATPATTAATGSQASSSVKVSANTASAAELQAALEGAGVTNAARWVKEVEEYRPYPTSDPTLAKLQSELAKYNPGTDTLHRILSVLEP